MQEVIYRNRELLYWSFGISLFVLVSIYFEWWSFVTSLAPLKFLFDTLLFPIILTVQTLRIKIKSAISTAILLLALSSLNFIFLWWLGGLNLNDGESQLISQYLLRIWFLVQGICSITYIVISLRRERKLV